MRLWDLGTPGSIALQVQGQLCTAIGKITNPTTEPCNVTSPSHLHKSTMAPARGPRGQANNAVYRLRAVTDASALTVSQRHIRTFYLQAQHPPRGAVLWRTWPEGDTHLSQEAQSDEHPLRQ